MHLFNKNNPRPVSNESTFDLSFSDDIVQTEETHQEDEEQHLTQLVRDLPDFELLTQDERQFFTQYVTGNFTVKDIFEFPSEEDYLSSEDSTNLVVNRSLSDDFSLFYNNLPNFSLSSQRNRTELRYIPEKYYLPMTETKELLKQTPALIIQSDSDEEDFF